MSVVNLVLSEKYYCKDPQSSDLGRCIISEGIILLDQLGFEKFTFRKLAEHINSTEASIYRYFDNKLMLLNYLTTLYWTWMEYRIDYKTHHISDHVEKIDKTLLIITNADNDSMNLELPGITISALRNIVASESDKTYLTKEVDEINSQGLYKGFKSLCHRIALNIEEINPDYGYPQSIVSTILEASHQQSYFAQHLPSITEVSIKSRDSIEIQVYSFLKDMVFRLLNIK